MISGINHLTFAVSDLERSLAFYEELLGCRLMARFDRGAYLLAGPTWLCLTIDAAAASRPHDDYTHSAFSLDAEQYEPTIARLRAAGVSSWQDNRSEGASFYFCDPDGHKLEIHLGTLRSRLEACRLKPFQGMVFFDEEEA